MKELNIEWYINSLLNSNDVDDMFDSNDSDDMFDQSIDCERDCEVVYDYRNL